MKRQVLQLSIKPLTNHLQVFSGEKTNLSDDFTEFEKDIEVRRIGVERFVKEADPADSRLHATSIPFFQQITKVKQTADPFPPAGSGKDKILYTEALGLVMIDYGGDIGDTYGRWKVKPS